jgi:alkanesulfonate monooxygenase SsuD/methylene tetrahydromethanopterin reductase-like flavin-dependent oxidoreductase (luciferase family)
MQVAVASPGYIAADGQQAKDIFWKAWESTMTTLGKVRGFAAPTRDHYDAESGRDGALFAGDPEEIADRIIELHKKIKHTRHYFQMDVGQLPHDKFLQSIELLGTEVAPRVRKALQNGQYRQAYYRYHGFGSFRDGACSAGNKSRVRCEHWQFPRT